RKWLRVPLSYRHSEDVKLIWHRTCLRKVSWLVEVCPVDLTIDGAERGARINQRLLYVAMAVVGLDQLAKAFFGRPIAEHSPALTTLPLIVYFMAIQIAVGVAAYRLGWRRNKPLIFGGLALLCAGLASNWIDRAVRG